MKLRTLSLAAAFFLPVLCATAQETEAEAVAYVVCRAFGFDCSTRSSDYIQLYRGDANTLSQSLEAIQQASAQLIAELSPETSGRKTEEEERHVA